MIDAALLLSKMLARAGNVPELNQTAAKIAWQRAAGDGLRAHAVPLRLKDKTLVVGVADAVWQKQLQAMSSELIFRINQLLRQETVRVIEFRINPAAIKDQTSARGCSSRGPAQPLPANVISSAVGIEDLDLRERFIRAAGNCISRRDSIVNDTTENPNSAI